MWVNLAVAQTFGLHLSPTDPLGVTVTTGLKYIAFLECAAENLDEMIGIWEERTKAHHTVKTILPPYTMANTPKGYSGFTIFETDSEEELMHYVTEYSRVASVEVTPIWESRKSSSLFKKLEHSVS
jgi:hypothetical protein